MMNGPRVFQCNENGVIMSLKYLKRRHPPVEVNYHKHGNCEEIRISISGAFGITIYVRSGLLLGGRWWHATGQIMNISKSCHEYGRTAREPRETDFMMEENNIKGRRGVFLVYSKKDVVRTSRVTLLPAPRLIKNE